MPQLEISTFPSQIFWLVVSFLILYIIMAKVIVPRISSVIKNRENEIKNNIHISSLFAQDNLWSGVAQSQHTQGACAVRGNSYNTRPAASTSQFGLGSGFCMIWDFTCGYHLYLHH